MAALLAAVLTAASPAPSPGPHKPLKRLKSAVYSLTTVPKIVHAGDSVTFEARTTFDIVTVRAAVQVAWMLPNYEYAFAKRGPGRFTMSIPVPTKLPPIFRGTYKVRVYAVSEGGQTLWRSVDIRVE